MYDNPIHMRYGNLVMKNVLILVIMLMAFSVYWKRRHVRKPMAVPGNVNVVTLKQTVTLLTLFSFDNTLLAFIITTDNALGISNELVFLLEMLRVIFIENIFFKFLVPLYLLQNSRTSLPALWAERNCRKQKFFITALSLTPRQIISRYQEEEREPEIKSSFNRRVVYIRNSCLDVDMDIPTVEIH